MFEDDVYRTSSQYRYWSYTPSQLTSIRQKTNDLASTRVLSAFHRAHQPSDPSSNSTTPQVTTLTVPEELRIITWGCLKILELSSSTTPRIPSSIAATAIQYLRRFYLTNSPMTYHPRQIMLCALFLATKAEHFYISLARFVEGLDASEEEVRAPEFLLMQGLRFTLDVRHPMRGLEGGVAEMGVLLREGGLELGKGGLEGERRIGQAADKAKKILMGAAQMTDAYFLYTPSQIWLAAVLICDRELGQAYLHVKLEGLGQEGDALREKLYETLQGCVELLEGYKDQEDDANAKKELKRIGKKLTMCQNPDKVDIVAVVKAKAAEKREQSDGSEGEKALKKRKLERDRLQKDGDVFGPDLKSIS